MTDRVARYALAFPATPQFRRVLDRYRGSCAFVRLSLCFLLVHPCGRVEERDADSLQGS